MKHFCNRLVGAGLAVTFFAYASSVRAEAITFYFSGTIDTVEDANNVLGGAVEVGAPFSGHYTFDSTAADSNGNPTIAQYASTGAEHRFVATVGGITFTRLGTDPFPGVEIIVGDDNGDFDTYSVNAQYDVTASPPINAMVTYIRSDISEGVRELNSAETAMQAFAEAGSIYSVQVCQQQFSKVLVS